MSMFIPTIISSHRAIPFAGLRDRLRNSCSLAVLSLAGVAVFSNPAAAACPDPAPLANGGTITINTTSASSGCFGINFGTPQYNPYSGLNLLVTNTGSITASGTGIGNTGFNAVGAITIDGYLQSRVNGSQIIAFGASTPSAGKITFGQTARVETQDRGGTPIVDLRGLPLLDGGFENNGTITVKPELSSVVGLSGTTVNGSIVNNGMVTSTQNFLGATSSTINGDVNNSGTITASLGPALTFSNTTTVNGSIINSGSILGLVGSGVTLNAGTNVSGSLTNSGTISGFDTAISAIGTTIAGGIYNSGTLDGKISGINYTGANTIGTITNTAGATIRGGTNSLNLAFGSATIVENSGTLDGAVNLGSVHTLNINGNAARVIGDTTGTGTSAVNGNGNFTSEGNFTVPTFAVTNGRTILLHTVTANTTSVAAPGTLQIGNNTASGHVGGNIANAGVVEFNRSDAYTYGYVISGAGRVEQKGPGVLILTGDQTYTGGTTVSGGILQLGDGGTTGSVAGNILNNSAVAFNRSDDYTYGGVISGSGTMTQKGPGKLILSGDNTYTGGTTVASGAALQIGNGGATGSLVGDIANGGAVAFNRSDNYTYGGVISGTGSVEQKGPGTLILSKDQTYTGGTTVSGGTLQLGNNTASGSVVGNMRRSTSV